MEGVREFTCKEGLLLKEEQRLGKWKKRWMVLRVNEKGDPSLYYYQVEDYINECMPLGFVVPSSCTLFEYPAKSFAFELVSPPSYNGLSPRPATHFRFQATNSDEFKAWLSVLSLYTMPIEEMHNVARNGTSPVRSHSSDNDLGSSNSFNNNSNSINNNGDSFVQSPITRSPTSLRSKDWEDNEAVLMKLFPDVELQTIIDALEFCRGNRNDAIDLLAEQNKLSSSTNNKNLLTGLSPHNQVDIPAPGQLKRAPSSRHISQTPTLISTPSPFLTPEFSSPPQLPKELLSLEGEFTHPPPHLPTSYSSPSLHLSSLSISNSNDTEGNNTNNPNVYKPKAVRLSPPPNSLSPSSSYPPNSYPSHSRLHAPIVPPILLPISQDSQYDRTQHKEEKQEITEDDKENTQPQQQFLNLQHLLQKNNTSSPNNPVSSSSTPQTPPSLQMPASPPTVHPSRPNIPPLSIPSSPPPSSSVSNTSQHYVYYNQHQKQQNYQPLVSPNSPSSLSSSSNNVPHISLQSTPQLSPLSPLSPRSPSSPPSSSSSASPRLHHQFTHYRYAYQSAPMMGHPTLRHFEAYSSPEDASSYHAHSHPHFTHQGFGGYATNYNHFGQTSPNSFSPNGSPNFGNFHTIADGKQRAKPSPISFRIVGATRNTYYMDYIVEVVTPDLRWLVYRRYSNFSLLNSKLLKMELAHPSKNVMPPKQFSLPPFPPPFASDDLVNKRVESLGVYLNSLVDDNHANAKFFLSHPIGQAFIDPHITSNEHNKIVNNLEK